MIIIVNMAGAKDDGEGKWGWLSTGKGIALLITAILGVPVAGYKLYDSYIEHQGTPTFSGRIEEQDTAQDFVDFLNDHDDEVVELDVECVPFDEPAWCTQADSETYTEYGQFGGDAGDAASLLEVFTETPCAASQDWCDGTYWVFPILLNGSDERVDNGEFGAGALVVKGEFKVAMYGGLGSKPAAVDNVTITAVEEAK